MEQMLLSAAVTVMVMASSISGVTGKNSTSARKSRAISKSKGIC